MFVSKCERVKKFLSLLGYDPDNDVTCIPISRWTGEGLTSRADHSPAPWITGKKTLMEVLEDLSSSEFPTEIHEFQGERFIIELKIFSPTVVVSKGFQAVIHVYGKAYPCEVDGMYKGQKFLTSRDSKKLVLWRFPKRTIINTNRVLIRLDTATIGIGRIVGVLP
jgi:hypothetical protein